MFAPRGNPSGLFSLAHIIMLIITYAIVTIALLFTYKLDHKKINKLMKIFTIVIIVLELIKIGYNFYYKCYNLNYWFPLSYCAMFIYAMIMASFGKNKIKHIGETFISCSFIAGFAFILFPTTSLTEVPFYHYLALYSFFYHGCMLYFGLLILISKYNKVNKKDLLSYSIYVLIVSIIGSTLNLIFDTNLMFLSRLSNMPIEFLNKIGDILGPLFLLVIVAIYIFGPYLTCLLVQNIIYRKENKNVTI